MFNKAVMKCFAVLWCGLIGLILFYIVLPVAPRTAYAQAQATPTATTTTGTPTVSFTVPGASSLTGHAGTKVTVTGQGFSLGTTGTMPTVTVYATPGPQQCVNGGTLYSLAPNVATLQSDGSFTLDARWPHGSGVGSPPEDPGTSYSICVISAIGNQSAVSTQTFTVAPALTATPSKTSLNPGDSLTIIGTNWTPPEPLTVSLVSSMGQTVAQQTITPEQTGNFNVPLTLDANVTPGQYTLKVVTASDAQGPQYQNPNPITVNALATPTPTAGPSPTATATTVPTPTPTSAPATTGTGGNDGSSQGGSGSSGMTVFIFILGGLGVLMVITGLVMFAVSSLPTTPRTN